MKQSYQICSRHEDNISEKRCDRPHSGPDLHHTLYHMPAEEARVHADGGSDAEQRYHSYAGMRKTRELVCESHPSHCPQDIVPAAAY